MLMPTVLAAGLETAINRYLSLDPDALPPLAALDGAVIAIDLAGLDLTLYLFPSAQGLRVMGRYEGEPTVQIHGTPLALIRQWRGQPVDSEITVEGDAAAGRQFQALLARLDIDWEEQFSQVIGDAVAHRLGQLWRGFRQWGQQASAMRLRDSGEYLQQELRALPSRRAVESFLSAVDALREDADRLEARIARLHRLNSS
jgi:ubiquinone biosynthesis protein UbiJ